MHHQPPAARPGSGPGPGHRRAAGWLLAAAGVAYALWLLELVLPTGLSSVSAYVSDHNAAGQPYRWLFRASDAIAGTLLVAAVWPLRAALPRSRWVVVVLLGLATFGLATVVDAVFTLDCVGAIDPSCRARELRGDVSAGHLVHLVSSSVAQLAALAAVVGVERLTTGARRTGWRRAVRVEIAVLLIGMVLSIALYWARLGGLPQRIQLLAMTAGMLTAAGWLNRRPPAADT